MVSPAFRRRVDRALAGTAPNGRVLMHGSSFLEAFRVAMLPEHATGPCKSVRAWGRPEGHHPRKCEHF